MQKWHGMSSGVKYPHRRVCVKATAPCLGNTRIHPYSASYTVWGLDPPETNMPYGASADYAQFVILRPCKYKIRNAYSLYTTRDYVDKCTQNYGTKLVSFKQEQIVTQNRQL